VTTTEWNGLPVVAFEDLVQIYPPETHDLFVALGYQDMNGLREAKCHQSRELGYTLPSLIHPQSGLPTDCVYGDNCFVMNQVHVHPRVRFGDNVFVWSGAMVGHHSTIGDNCWLTSNVSVSGVVSMGKNCFLAVNATVGHSVEIADHCFIGANALVVKSTKPHEVYVVESTKAFRLNSQQFLRMSSFSHL
jgi:sugar O-acyltransferase (sialic acid O-acetyltransferase NeuD family)